ncbi:MAG: CBS domain-containing protein, partial [Thermoproteales archaeon]|nr:CBS domain-containing protein [Thermoproteales archaeon]
WKRRPYEKSFINEIMNQNVLLVREETPVEDVAKEMLNTESEVAIVTDEKGLLKGIITKEELADALARLRGEMKIENVMAPPRLGVVHPHHSLAHAVKRMKAYYLDALAVAVGGIAEGVVSENRLPFIPLEDSKTGLRTRRLLWVRKLEKGGRKMGRYIKITPLLVEDVMVPTRDIVETDETLENAINIMKKLNIDGLPVINKNGKVIGVVCKHDYIRELARSSKLTGKIKTKVREARLSE